MLNKYLFYKYINWEKFFLVIILGIYILIGLSCADRLYPVWLDEVTLTQPAYNLYIGKGFTSTAWYHQSAQEFHVSTSPLYVLLLSFWIKIFGFTIVAVRIFNYTLMIASVLMIWLSVIRLRLITSSWIRLILVFLILTGTGVTFNYISGRYDCIGIILISASLFVYSWTKSITRNIFIICLGSLFPWAGLSLIAYFVILSGLLLIFFGSSLIKFLLYLLVGIFIGFIFLSFTYHWNGVWDDFVNLSVAHSIASNSSNILAKLLDKSAKLLDKDNYLCAGLLTDTSYSVLLIAMITVTIYWIYKKRLQFPAQILFGCATLVIPITMCLLGKYPIYYSWMSYIPLTLCLCSSFNRLISQQQLKIIPSSLLFTFFILISLYASFNGLPKSLKNTIANWQSFDYQLVEEFIADSINNNESVYSDFSAFYAVEKITQKAIYPLYPLSFLSTQDKNDISAIIIDPREEVRAPWNVGFDDVAKTLGGKWYETENTLDSEIYNLKVFKRARKKITH